MKKVLLSSLLFFLIGSSYAQKDEWTKKWQLIDSLELQGRVQSAQEVTAQMISAAQEEKNYLNLIKAKIFYYKFYQINHTDSNTFILKDLNTTLHHLPVPYSNLLLSYKAGFLHDYYSRHRWQLRNRKEIDNPDPVNLETWAATRLEDSISTYYQLSLENKEVLAQTATGEIGELLSPSTLHRKYRPSLFDLLAFRAIDHYSEANNYRAARPGADFAFNAPVLYGSTKEFLSIELPTFADSPELRILRLYQELERLHRESNNTAAKIYVQLERLAYVDQRFTGQDQWELYSKALERLANNFRGAPATALVFLKQAQELNKKARATDEKENLLYPRYRRQALKLCEKIIAEFPNSAGAQEALRLKSEITAVDISSVHEEVLPEHTPGLLYVSYRSLDSVRLRIYKVPGSFLQDVSYRKRDSLVETWIQKQPLTEQKYALPAAEDYNPHSIETPIPGLELGKYLIYLSGASLDGDKGFSYSLLDISNLVLLETNFDKNTVFQVFNRSSGEPIASPEVSIFDSDDKLIKRLTAGVDGKFKYPAGNTRNVKISITKDGDSLVRGFSRYFSGRRDQEEPTMVTTMFYLDRAIYRPGQEVHFKGVLLQHKNGMTETVPGEYVEVFIKDPNFEEVTSFRLKTNKYGSFSSSFDLPNSGITGRFIISTKEDQEGNSPFWKSIKESGDFYNQNTYFSVEEYKRPSFEVAFDSIDKVYSLGDTIEVTGKALSFMGAPIGSAKVKYEVTRREITPNWWGRRFEEPVVVKTDSVMTGEKGQYVITFPAVPSQKDLDDPNLLYIYTVKASVTDVSGETREGSTAIKIGKKDLLLNLRMKDRVNKHDSLPLNIRATNLNDQSVPIEGILKIYKLQGPDRILKERLWDAPEFQLLSEETFRQDYPEIAYKEMPEPENWPKGDLVHQLEFSTDAGSTREIVRVEWPSGKYILELDVTNGENTVSAKQLFDVIDSQDSFLPDNQRLQASLQNSDFLNEGRAKLLLQTAYSDLPVQVKLFDQQKVMFEKLLHLNGRKELLIPIKETDANELRIEITAIKNNSLMERKLSIPLLRPKNRLQITTATFRSKIEPGMEETWSFKVTDTSSTVPDAEILASMYDASLDQFASAEWNTSAGLVRTRYNFPWSRHRGINSKVYQSENFPYSYYYRPLPRRFDQLNRFGFVFSEARSSEYRRYLQQLKTEKIPGVLIGNTRGKVTNPRGYPLPGVNIRIGDSQKGTQTDFNGEFALDTKEGDALLISYLGFETVTIVVGANRELFIVLEPSSAALEEVVMVEEAEEVEELALMEMQSIAAPPPATQLAGSVAGVSLQSVNEAQVLQIRGSATIENSTPLFIVDGKVVTEADIPVDQIISSEKLTGAEATALYGARAANGVVVITTKKSLEDLQQVVARKDLDETAFFFPHLQLSEDGKVSFSFTSPEALTQWKIRLLGHTTDWTTGTYTGSVITQKELSLQPNTPRFLREGDNIVFKAKLSNLTTTPMLGTAQLQIFDALTGNSIDTLLGNTTSIKNFKIQSSGSEAISWKLQIPEGLKAVRYRVVARAGDYSDGEEDQLPVLSNRMLVQESLPMFVRAGESESYVFENFQENESPSLEHESFSIEYSSNPAWYAVMSLPYLLEFEHECSEQVFARLYANSLASHIINSQPKLKEVFEQWRKDSSLVSQLERKEGLSPQLLSETPWLQEALSETERKQYIGNLFELEQLARDQKEMIRKLERMQMSSGAFPWFSGGNENLFITRHILAGLGHLKQLGVSLETTNIVKKGIGYLDNITLATEKSHSDTTALKSYYSQLSNLHYLYARSFFSEEVPAGEALDQMIGKMVEAVKENWIEKDLYGKALSMLVLSRYGEKVTAETIMTALRESAIHSEEHGMYWKENTPGWYWYRAPIETQALLIEAFAEVGGASEAIEEMKIWLLQNKRSTHWSTTKSSTEAIYALLLQGADWLKTSNETEILVGGTPISAKKLSEVEEETATGYFKIKWQEEEIRDSFGEITLSNNNASPGYGAAYWKYYENIDKIQTSATSPLSIEKELYLNVATASGNTLKKISAETPIHTGDLISVRLVIRATADMDYVHLEDMRASGFEPTDVISKYTYQGGAYFYQSTRDAATHFFFERLRQGTYVLEYTVRANNPGYFSNGISTIQSMYAPEFGGHTEGVKVRIE